MRKFQQSMTLVEVMVVAMILAVAVVGLWKLFATSLDLTIQAKEISIMTDDAKDVIEKIKNVNFVNVTTVFTNGTAVNESIVGGFILGNESIVVSYPDGTAVDPLPINVEISWTGKDTRNHSYTFKTIRTKGL